MVLMKKSKSLNIEALAFLNKSIKTKRIVYNCE